MKDRNISIYKPKYKDLWFRKTMLGDDATMSYNHSWGGTISFPEEDWQDWYDCWLNDNDKTHYYRYVKNEEDTFIGEVAYHFDAELNGYIANVIIYAKYRGKGYGGMALNLLCLAAKENGLSELYDDIAIDNSAIKLFIKNGFVEMTRTNDKVILKKQL